MLYPDIINLVINYYYLIIKFIRSIILFIIHTTLFNIENHVIIIKYLFIKFHIFLLLPVFKL